MLEPIIIDSQRNEITKNWYQPITKINIFFYLTIQNLFLFFLQKLI